MVNKGENILVQQNKSKDHLSPVKTAFSRKKVLSLVSMPHKTQVSPRQGPLATMCFIELK